MRWIKLLCREESTKYRRMENWVWFILIGLAAGFLAGTVVKGHGFGILGNLVVGVIGAFAGRIFVRAGWSGLNQRARQTDFGIRRVSGAARGDRFCEA